MIYIQNMSNEITNWSDNFIKTFAFTKHNNNISATYDAFQ